MANPAMAITIARVRVLQGLEELLSAYQKHQRDLNKELVDAQNATNDPKSRREKLADIARRAKLGDIRYDYPLLGRRIEQINQQVKFMEENLSKFSELFSPGISNTAKTLNRALVMQLLSAPGAVLQNGLGATYVQDVALKAGFGSIADVVKSPFGVTKEIARVAIDRSIKAAQKANPALAGEIAKLIPFKNELADFFSENTVMVKMLQRSGQLPSTDVMNRMKAAREVGLGGEISHPGANIPVHLRAAKVAFGTPLALMHEMMFPKYFDNFANTVMGHRANHMLLRLFSHTMDIGLRHAVKSCRGCGHTCVGCKDYGRRSHGSCIALVR
jgi:hypothetical protein